MSRILVLMVFISILPLPTVASDPFELFGEWMSRTADSAEAIGEIQIFSPDASGETTFHVFVDGTFRWQHIVSVNDVPSIAHVMFGTWVFADHFSAILLSAEFSRTSIVSGGVLDNLGVGDAAFRSFNGFETGESTYTLHFLVDEDRLVLINHENAREYTFNRATGGAGKAASPGTPTSWGEIKKR